MKAWILHWGPAIVLMVLIFIASATPGSELPKFGVWDVFVKKGGHMVGYALLAAAYFHALSSGRHVTRFQFIVAMCLATLYAVSDEFHQRFTPGRTASPWDVCIDAVGGFIGLTVWFLIRTRLARWHKTASS
jgi:VanZ family protein